MPAGEIGVGYFDSSVLAKCYLRESGSASALEALSRHGVSSSAVAAVELASALRRQRESGVLSDDEVEHISARLQADRRQWSLLAVDDAVLVQAETLTRRISVRALDAIHVASALELSAQARRPIPFITADERQRRVAAALGLDVLFVA